MLKHDRAEVCYAELVKRARRLEANSRPPFKIALLADVSTLHLAPVRRALFASNGFDAEIYEAGFDTVETEALHPGSGLFAFQPQAIVILQSIVKLKAA